MVAAPVIAQEQAQEFQGKIAKKYEDSIEWWPKSPRPPELEAPRIWNSSKLFSGHLADDCLGL
jgi:hypothetical protein